MIVSILKIITIDVWVFHSFRLNYILIGMAFSATLVNLVPEEKTEAVFEKYNPLLNLSLVFIIINLGFTLLPHSGVSLVFTGIAAATLSEINS